MRLFIKFCASLLALGLLSLGAVAEAPDFAIGDLTPLDYAKTSNTVGVNFVGVGGEQTNMLKFGERACTLSKTGITRCSFCAIRIDISNGERIVGEAKLFAMSEDPDYPDTTVLDASHSERVDFLIVSDEYLARTEDELTAWCDTDKAFNYRDLVRDNVSISGWIK